jgi:predicted nuclease of predicted toxin-antitoxin system
VKLLFDQNLSPRIVKTLADVYPGSVHVRDVGLNNALDEAVWEYAARHGLTIISKDSDFHQRSFLFGPPPKVIWIRRGNCSTKEIEAIMRAHRTDLQEFEQGEESAFLTLE